MLRLPDKARHPLLTVAIRLAVALGLVFFVALVAYLDRHGYKDAAGGQPGFLDCIYYATVSITTTGYGDIIPITNTSRLLTTLLITPARILFLVILVGTTLEVLASQVKQRLQQKRWSETMNDHIIICGFGVKGQSAYHSLIQTIRDPHKIVVIDQSQAAINEADRLEIAMVVGDFTKINTLQQASIEKARKIIITPERDDTSVLACLTARELNENAIIVGIVKETENAHLIKASGADSVIVSSASAGRMAAFGASNPHLVDVLDDLLSLGSGIDIAEREVLAQELGPISDLQGQVPIIGVVREDTFYRFYDKEAQMLQEDDTIIYLLPAKERLN